MFAGVSGSMKEVYEFVSVKSLKFGAPTLLAIVCLMLFSQYGDSSGTTIASAEISGTGIPLRLIIPRIHMDANIEAVQKINGGFLKAPESALDAGWYSESSRMMEGEKGTAVIDGVVNWRYGATAMFADLHFLEAGDEVSVLNDKGETISFVVREVKAFDPKGDTAEIFTRFDGKAHLNLVTLDGAWRRASKSFAPQIVVFTDELAASTTPEMWETN